MRQDCDKDRSKLGPDSVSWFRRQPTNRRSLEGRGDASLPFQPDILEVADAGSVCIVAVAEHGDVGQVRSDPDRRRKARDLNRR
jgi:hypothetical protein